MRIVRFVKPTPTHDPETVLSIAASELASSLTKAQMSGSAIMLVAAASGLVVEMGMIFDRFGAEGPFYIYRLIGKITVSRALGWNHVQLMLKLRQRSQVRGQRCRPTRPYCGLRSLDRSADGPRPQSGYRPAPGLVRQPRVMAELSGWDGEAGRMLVREVIGRHFYDLIFHYLYRAGAREGNQSVADLGPCNALHVWLVLAETKLALGHLQDDFRPERDMLLDECFRDEGYINNFDDGTTLDTNTVRYIRFAKRSRRRDGRCARNGKKMLVSRRLVAELRAAAGPVLAKAPTAFCVPHKVMIERTLNAALRAEGANALCKTLR